MKKVPKSYRLRKRKPDSYLRSEGAYSTVPYKVCIRCFLLEERIAVAPSTSNSLEGHKTSRWSCERQEFNMHNSISLACNFDESASVA